MEYKIGKVLKSQDGDTFVEIINGEDRCRISLEEVGEDYPTVKRKLSPIGVHLLTSRSDRRFREQMQSAVPSGACLSAKRPGWLSNNIYVHPNGSIEKSENEKRQIFTSFGLEPTYGKKGSHRKWLEGITPFYQAEKLLRFSLQFALSAVVVSKVPSQRENLIMELVGKPEFGKTTLARCAASMFGGSDEGGLGIGRSASMTRNAFRQVLQGCNDTLMFLDETNVSDADAAENLKVIFEAASGEDRARYHDVDRKPPTRGAILMTGNIPLEDHARTPPPILEAARTRLLTMNMAEPIFTTLPEGYENRAAAISALSHLVDHHYGTAGRKMIGKIIKDEPKFVGDLMKHIEWFLEKARNKALPISDRQLRVFALCYATGKIATRAGILPASNVLKDVQSAMHSFCRCLEVTSKSPAVALLTDALEKNAKHIRKVSPTKANSKHSEAMAWRYNDGDHVQVFFTSSTAENWFGSKKIRTIKSLCDEDVIRGEEGTHCKPSIKAPKCIPHNGRVYSTRLKKVDLPFFRQVRKKAS
ncbi:hypothetical protein LCGC14_1250800 [marine sediment metagenome]|uniref:DUF927 domain-containing protein n=1 Tax=marine sediment metagenome TaxID=412755 RepID=A0A0F9NK95_9ZZZZ|tara:strand:+ start:4682 stop:6274 length:1593 start_codon:yes stop_codon:yes gene_type:complete